MPNQDSFYPDIQANDPILYATNPRAQEDQFLPGIVHVAKLNSADLIIESDQGRIRRHDCLHIDDPRCKVQKIWNEPGRGVFKLAAREIDRRKREKEVQAMIEQTRQVLLKLHAVTQRMDALEKNIEQLVLGGQPPRRTGRPRLQPVETGSS